MALIKCYECSKQISDLAPHCVHCGAPKKKAPSNKKVAPKKKSSAPKKKAAPKRKAGPKDLPSAQEMDRIIKKVLAKKTAKAGQKTVSSAPKKKAAVRVKESTPVSGDDSMTEVVMGVIVPIYLVGWGIASLYEELMFFVEEGFVAWVLFGWVVPLARALLWPLNVYQALVG